MYSEEQLRLIINTIPTLAWSARADGAAEFFNYRWLEYAGLSADQAREWGWIVALHPDDVDRLVTFWRSLLQAGEAGEIEARLRRHDGEFRCFLFRASPLRDESGNVVRWYGVNIDIEDRKNIEDALRQSEQQLQLVVENISGLVAVMSSEGEVEFVNQLGLKYFGKSLDQLAGWRTSDAVHPDDLPAAIAAWKHCVETGDPYEIDHRLRRDDGTYRWFHARGRPLHDANGKIVRWYVLLTDIDDRHRLETALQHERDRLRLLLDLNNRVASQLDLRQVFQNLSSELRRVFKSDFIGVALPDDAGKNFRQLMVNYPLPENRGVFQEGGIYPIDASCSGVAFRTGKPFMIRNLSEGWPLWNRDRDFSKAVRQEPFNSGCFLPIIASGEILGVLQVTSLREAAFTDEDLEFLEQVAGQVGITLKNALQYEKASETKDRLHAENVALREHIDQALMFEEIVGSSAALQSTLAAVMKVAPTDSTVLITGETGTGKELIARAIHKRSARARHAFVGVNCASIPPALIASELFGHEKGAFTGALQLRQGRFELAHSGTIFLDEVGELPAETQVSLLRVLQERHFERVGGNRQISTDVRVIAATNRDLLAAVSAGTFRSDLFYRLNVFPVHVPALRERKEDIPMLVEYFVRRFADKMGKRIREIDKKTLELCQRYDWPGNIRELQNIVERSVILGSGEVFRVDQSWLAPRKGAEQELPRSLKQALAAREKEMIEAALAASKGKIAGPSGAAARLGIPASTLDSKIKQLRIKRAQYSDDVEGSR